MDSPRSPMDSTESPARVEGTLSKDVQASIGSQLRREYQKIVDEGVPDRFVELLRRFENKTQDTSKDAPGHGQEPANEPDHNDTGQP
jgi:Anti-sigma factor NepR